MNMREIQKVQQKLMKMQEELEATQFSGTAGGGAVTISMSGKYEISAVKIDPEAFSADDIEELEVMVKELCIETRALEGGARVCREQLTLGTPPHSFSHPIP